MKHLIFLTFLSFSISTFAQVDIVCFGSFAENYSINPNPGSTYSWQVNGGGVIVGSSTGTSIVVDWSLASIGLIPDAIILTETVASNCSADVGLDVDIVDNPNQTLAVDDNEICIGDQIILTATDYSNTTYDWIPNILSTSSGSYTPTSTTDDSFSVTATDVNGCISTSSVTITINDLPTIVASISDSEICLGESVDISATSGLVSYTWTPSVITGSSGTYTPLLAETNYNVVGTDANGCISSDDVSLVINDIPSLDLLVDGANTTTICLGESIDLQATTGFTLYEWTPNVVTNEGGLYVPTSLLETDYSVIATDANGCQNTDNVNITINNIPNPGPIIFN
jgi:hypothetical protein